MKKHSVRVNALKRLNNRKRFARDPVFYKCHIMWHSSRRRARKLDVENTLTLENVLKMVPPDRRCPILGIELCFTTTRRPTYTTPTLDRINPALGYTPDNAQMVSRLANTMKSNGTLDQMIALGRWAEQRAALPGAEKEETAA